MKRILLIATPLALATACNESMIGDVSVQTVDGSDIANFEVHARYWPGGEGEPPALEVWDYEDHGFTMWKNDPNEPSTLDTMVGDNSVFYNSSDGNNAQFHWPDGDLSSWQWTVDDSQTNRSYTSTLTQQEFRMDVSLRWDGGTSGGDGGGGLFGTTTPDASCTWEEQGFCYELDTSTATDSTQAVAEFEETCEPSGGSFSTSGCDRGSVMGVCSDAELGAYSSRWSMVFYEWSCEVEIYGDEWCDSYSGDYSGDTCL